VKDSIENVFLHLVHHNEEKEDERNSPQIKCYYGPPYGLIGADAFIMLRTFTELRGTLCIYIIIAGVIMLAGRIPA
jgi:hypothetical protein